MKKRGYAIAPEHLAYWIIGIIVLALLIYLGLVLTDKDANAINIFKNLFKMRRP